MKRNIFLTIVIILLITGGISYLVIWYRNKKNAAAGADPNQTVSTGNQYSSNTTINTGPLKPTNTESIWAGAKASSGVPTTGKYDTWTAKLGHATFPLGNGSKGVEVVKVQEELNAIAASKPVLGFSTIDVDGIWGPKTDARFKALFPGYNSVTLGMFITEFDKNGEILK